MKKNFLILLSLIYIDSIQAQYKVSDIYLVENLETKEVCYYRVKDKTPLSGYIYYSGSGGFLTIFEKGKKIFELSTKSKGYLLEYYVSRDSVVIIDTLNCSNIESFSDTIDTASLYSQYNLNYNVEYTIWDFDSLLSIVKRFDDTNESNGFQCTYLNIFLSVKKNQDKFEWITYYFKVNNHLVYELKYKQVIKQGSFVRYDLNGKIVESFQYKNGVKHGSGYIILGNGKILQKTFENGKLTFEKVED